MLRALEKPVTNSDESPPGIYARVSNELSSAADCASPLASGGTRAPVATGVATSDDPLKCATLLQMELPNDGDQNSEPDRQICRRAHPHAPPDARHVADPLGRRPRPHLPADPEIREGHQPRRRQPVAADRAHSQGAGGIFL